MKKNSRNTKGKIVSAAWKLFYEQGYDETTVEEIVEESGTSRGSFYHYFEGKDALLGSLAYLFDAKYTELEGEGRLEGDAFEVLLFLNRELFDMIEKRSDKTVTDWLDTMDIPIITVDGTQDTEDIVAEIISKLPDMKSNQNSP